MPSLARSRFVKNITSVVDYAYPNTRVLSWKGSMLKEEDMRGLASAKHLEEYIGLLEHTPYKREMTKITQNDINSVENILLLSFIDQCSLVARIAPKDTKKFFSALNLMHEVELIKLVMNRFDSKTDKRQETDYSIYSPVLGREMRDFLRGADDVKDRDDAVSMLKGTRYGFLRRLSSDEVKTQGYIASALDRYYFHNLWSSIETLSSKDGGYARRIIGKEIEMMNLLIAVRSKICGFKGEKFLVDVPYGLNNRIMQVAGKDLGEIASALEGTHYSEILEAGLKAYEKDKSILTLELNLRKDLLNEYQKMFKASQASIGTLLSFIKLKEYELKNARAIAVAIDSGLAQKDIMELVVL